MRSYSEALGVAFESIWHSPFDFPKYGNGKGSKITILDRDGNICTGYVKVRYKDTFVYCKYEDKYMIRPQEIRAWCYAADLEKLIPYAKVMLSKRS